MTYPRYPAYTPSGVDWLGEVPAGWDVKRLKCVVSWNDDVLPETTPADHPLNYVEISDVSEVEGIIGSQPLTFGQAPSRARRLVQAGDTIISTVRTYLKAIAYIAVPLDNMVVSTGFAVLRPRAAIVPAFLGYVARSPYFLEVVVARSVGISYPAVNASDLVDIPMLLPPLAEQRAIAAFLDREAARIDALIAKQTALLALLAEKRQALISEAVTRGLDAAAPLKDSGVEWLGEVPAHWQVKALKKIAYLHRGYDLTADERTAGPFPVVTSAGAVDTHNQSKAPGPGVVMGRYGTTGDLFYIEHDFWPHNTALYVHEFYGNLPRYIFYLLQILPYEAHSGKAAVPGIDRNDLHVLLVCQPPLAEQQAIVAYIDAETAQLEALAAKATQAIALLREHRSALISAAVTGQIDVRAVVGAAREPPQ